MQRRFYIDELHRFLRLVDAELCRPCTLVLVGESALLLGYCPDRSIADIEVWTASDRVIWTAAERASEKIPRPIHLRPAVAGSPRGMPFESRLQRLSLDGLRFLGVLVPEAHDLAILEAACEPTSAAIEALHRVHLFTLGTLLERHEEMKLDDLGRGRASVGFLGLVAKLYGKAKAGEIQRRLRKRPGRPASTPRHEKG